MRARPAVVFGAVFTEGTRLVLVQGSSSISGMVRVLGKVPVLEYGVGPMSGYVLLDSLGSEVTIKVLDGCGHIQGEEGVVHCTTCLCDWCASLGAVVGYAYNYLHESHGDDNGDHQRNRNGVPRGLEDET